MGLKRRGVWTTGIFPTLAAFSVGTLALMMLRVPVSDNPHGARGSGQAVAAHASPTFPMEPIASRRGIATHGISQLAFEPNQGQVDSRVKFTAHRNGYTLFLTDNEAVVSLANNDPDAAPHRHGRGTVLRMKALGARSHRVIESSGIQAGISNYYLGHDRHNWRSHVPHYDRITYRGVYPGVDLAYHGEQNQLEFDFVLAAYADPKPIELEFEGARSISLASSGDLVLSSSAGEMHFHQPIAYQQKNGAREPVEARFEIAGLNQVRFTLGTYDHTRELVIDPTLAYSTYLGGFADDNGQAIAVDSAGNAYLTGAAGDASFPATGFAGGLHDAFVTKIDPSGNTVYSTFIGGNDDDHGRGIVVDNAGDAYVVGNTQASSNFPTTTSIGPTGSQDVFVAKLDPTGALVQTTVFGGSLTESGNAIAIDGSGNAYVAGNTVSTDYPTVNPYQPALGSPLMRDCFVAKLNAAGTALVYSTYLGGFADDHATGMGVDPSGNAYVAGVTLSPNFPKSVNAIDGSCGTDGNCNSGKDDAFVTEFNAAGSALIYSTFLGGSSTDDATAIVVDSTGAAYVTGLTKSGSFPVFNAFQPSLGGPSGQNAFVTKIAPGGAAYEYSTYLGGSGTDTAYGLAVDASGNAFVTGSTKSLDFPQSDGLTKNTILNGKSDAFVAELATSGSALVYSTYIGGTTDEDTLGGGVGVDAAGNTYLTGDTSSIDFPVHAAQQSNFAGMTDAFAAKLTPANAASGFTVLAKPALESVNAGFATSPALVTVNPLAGFTGTVTLTCSGLPAATQCNFSPSADVTVGAGAASVQLTIATDVAATGARISGKSSRWIYALSLLPGLLLLNPHRTKRSLTRSVWRTLSGAALFLGLLGLMSCGGGGSSLANNGITQITPPGIYTVLITGTSGATAVNASPAITLTVF